LALAAFASAGDEERRRRPVDAAMLAVAVGVAIAAAFEHDDPTELGRSVTRVLHALPDWITTLLGGAFALSGLYAVVLLGLTVAAGDRPRLLRDLVIAGGFGLVAGLLSGQALTGDWPDLLEAPGRADEAFPVVAVAVLVAVVLTARPHLVRPARVLGQLLVLLSLGGAVALSFGDLNAAVGGFAIGAASAALVRLCWGSPGGAPSLFRVRLALSQLGLDMDDLAPSGRSGRDGTLLLEGSDPELGRLAVEVAGRDAADSRFLARLWRVLWYRDAGATLAVTRLQHVEHEALLLLLAHRAGVPAPELVAATATERGDALLVSRQPGPSLQPGLDLTAEQVEEAWRHLGALRHAGITHGRIDPQRLRVAPDGSLLWSGWATASVEPDVTRLNADAAGLLVLSALSIGPEAAVATAHRALGADQLDDAVPLVQRAALSGPLRSAAKERELDLDELRQVAAAETGHEPEELERLRRVSVAQLAMTAVTAFAVWLLVSQLADIGIDTIVDAVSAATVSWLVLALVFGQVPRVAQAVSTMGSSPYPLALGPTVALQFAVTFINLAVPSTAARIATVTRYFQKQGATAAAALSAGAIDGVSGFIVQVGILLVTIGFGLASLDLDIQRPERDSNGSPLLVLVVVLLAVAAVVLAVVPRLRAKVKEGIGEALGAVRGLRSPRRVAMLFGGNLAAEVLFSLTLGICALAYGYALPLATLLTINVAVAMFAGLMPVPGGMGVTEGALTLGLVAAGMTETDAMATALTYRAVTFYLPPIWGWVAFRWLTRSDHL
jgi:uncharacterized membrane protein YbhN (UPF0104 family)